MVIDPNTTEIVLTGANGFVGSAVLRRIRSHFPELPIKALIRKEPRQYLPGITYLKGELPQAIPPELFQRENVILLHFASLLKSENYKSFHRTNVEGTARLLEAGGQRIKKIIFGSSMSIYGQGPFERVSETASADPETDLARSRWAAEQEILRFARKQSCSAILLRPRFILGAGDKETLPALMRLHRKGLRIGSGEQRFSFIEIDDYAKLICQLAEATTAGAEAMNVAYEECLSLNQMFEAMGPFHLKGTVPANLLIALGSWLPPMRKLRTKLQLTGLSQALAVDKLKAVYPDLTNICAREKFAAVVREAKRLHET